MPTLEDLAKGFVGATAEPALTSAELALVKRSSSPPNIGPLSTAKPAAASDITPQTSLTGDIVRAELVRWLCTARAAHDLIDGGGLYITGCKIRGTAHHSELYPGGVLDLCSLTIPFPLIFHQCTLPTWVLLLGTNVPFLDFDGCAVGSIAADVLNVRGDLYLRNGFQATGSIRMSGARVGGDLDLSGATIVAHDYEGQRDKRHERGFALNAEGIHVAGDVLLTSSSIVAGVNPSIAFSATGLVCLDGAEIDGDLNCEGAALTIIAPSLNNGSVLSLQAAIVKGHVWLRNKFNAIGAVRLPGAQIDGNLDCSDGTFTNPWSAGDTNSGVALQADGARIGMDLRLTSMPAKEESAFKANGTVSLVGTHVVGRLNRKGGTFTQTAKPQQVQGSTHHWRPALDLRNTRVAYVSFPPGGDPPAGETRDLDGFVYDRILKDTRVPIPKDESVSIFKKWKSPKNWEVYLKWIPRSSGDPFQPQPYLQLAHALREDGDRAGAREVLIAMERKRPRRNAWRFWGWLQRMTIGYGYKPWRAFACWAVFVALGDAIFHWAGLLGFAPAWWPASPSDYHHFATYPPLHPIIFSIENSLPLVKFTEWDYWRPVGWLSYVTFGQMLVGWFFTTMGAVGLTNLIRKE